MRRLFLRSLLALLLACASAEAAGFSMEGQVLGPDGKGLAGARVELRPVLRVYEQGVRDLEGKGEPEAIQAVSGADGWYRFQVPCEGPWRAKAAAAGLPPLEFLPRMVIGEETLNPVWMRPAADVQSAGLPAPIRPAGSHPLTLEVYDGSRPVPGALVRDRETTLVLGRTGVDGSLLLDAPGPRAWALRIETRDGRIAHYDARPVPAASKPQARVRRRFLLPPAVILAGRVVDRDTGRPIANARVWPEADPAAFVATDASGSYRLPWTLGIPVVLTGRAEGYFAADQSIQTKEPRGVPPTLALWPTRILDGTVVRPDGEPVPEAEVRVFGLNPDFTEIGRTRASAQGRFRVPALHDGNYDVLAVAPSLVPGLAPAFETVTILPGTAGTSGIRLVMRPGRTARGRVVDEHGRPVAEARVELTRSPASLVDPDTGPPDGLHEAETDAGGRFEVAGLSTGWYDLAVSRAGFLPGSEPALEVADVSGAADLGTVTLERGATITGWVTGPDREPLAGAEVRSLLSVPGLEGTVTGPDGRFVLEGVDPSEELVLIFCRPDRGSEVLHIPEPPEVPFEVVLKPAARLSGRVVGPDGEPVAGVSVTARIDKEQGFQGPPCPMPDRARGRTDAEGRFDFFPLGSGTFYVSALKNDFIGPSPVAVEVQPGSETEAPPLVLERGSTVFGQVVAADGSPAPATIVSVPAPDGSYFLPDIADGDGRYRIDGVPAGEQLVQAQHTTLGSASRTVTVADGENRVDFTLDLEERHFAHGQVVDPGGEPVAGALVEDEHGGTVYSGGDGSFAIEVVLDHFDLTARKAGYAPARLSHWAAKGTIEGLELQLGSGASLSGRILGVEPGDMAGVKVTAANETDSIEALVSSDGVYRFPGLEPVSWWVNAELGDRSAGLQIDIAPGDGELTADLWLPERHEVRGRVLGPGGEPEEGVGVGLYNSDHEERTETGEDGTFSLEAYDGTYDVMAFTKVFAMVHGQVTVSGVPLEGLEIRLAGEADLTGHILGIPADEVQDVRLEVEPGMQRFGEGNEDGTYRFEGLGPGRWRVTARFDLNQVARDFTVRPGQTSVNVDLPFTLGDLTLSIRLAGYRQVEHGVAKLIAEGNPWSQEVNVEDNAFAFSRLKPGRYFLTVVEGAGKVVVQQEIELASSLEMRLDL
jgi:protocatechuate 3,4-dioxygenase beta subunit